MAYDPGAIEAALSAAVGDEPALIAELRLAFTDSAGRTLQAMRASATDEAWRSGAARLRGLAASFGAVRLMALASAAAEGAPHEPAMLKKLERAIARL